MLTLRRTLFERLLHLPLQALHEMKTGGILSRLTGDIETTTGLMQLAVVSPAVSTARLAIAVGVLVSLNWRLALTALAITPALALMSFTLSRRVRPIYRSLRKDAEMIDGRVGETFSGIRVVRAFRREFLELLDYMQAKGGVWFARLDQICDHVQKLIVEGRWTPRCEILPIYESPLPEFSKGR